MSLSIPLKLSVLTAHRQAADVGDEVFFTFLTKNHTVTQSSFANPCGRLEGGVDSGL